MLTNNEYKELLQKYNNMLNSLNLDRHQTRVLELQKEVQKPGFWDDSSSAQQTQKKLSTESNKVKTINDLSSSIENLEIAWELKDEKEIERAIKNANKIFTKLELETFLSGEFDQNNAIITIQSGAGGVDAQDFAAMIASMYQGFATKQQGWKWSTIDISAGEEGGVKSLTARIEGENVYGLMKEEIGVHRLVRLSPFNSNHTRETSFVSVEILPDGLDQVEEVEINDDDLKWDFFLSSGNGGQSVNTTYSAVRVTHLPTKFVATCQNERSQAQNKIIALEILKNKIALKKLKEQKDRIKDLKGIDQSADFGSQIRSYVLHPYKQVKDHRSKHEEKDIDAVLNGEKILDFIWSVKQMG